MLIARRDDGTSIRLSKQEHALLLRFVREPHTLITRADLLKCLNGNGGALSERNIDYLVNRLRKRLGDSARDSRFIATRYGVGYAWVADPVKPEPISAFLLIGPVCGETADLEAVGDFPDQLATTVSSAFGGYKTVVSALEWEPDPHGLDKLAFTLDVKLHVEGGHLHLALILREGPTRRFIQSFRRIINQGEEKQLIEDIAHQVVCSIWRDMTLADGGPEAAVIMSSDEKTEWHGAAAQIQAEKSILPAGAEVSVMQALNKYESLIRSVHEAPITDEQWVALETEIEDHVLRALPDAHDNPRLLLSIARLLRFIDRGYLALAGRITEEAFKQSVAFDEVFAMRGQIEASRGELDTAVAIYDKAIKMTEPSSRTHIHLLVLKIIALQAGENRPAVRQTVIDLNNIVPVNQLIFGLFLVPLKARQLNPEAESSFSNMSPDDGRHLSRYLFRAWARQFRKPEHQENIVKGFTRHLQRHHGSIAVDQEITRRFPNLISATAEGHSIDHSVPNQDRAALRPFV